MFKPKAARTKKLRTFTGPEAFNPILIDRKPKANDKPLDNGLAALGKSSSMIIAPEGRWNMGDNTLPPFRVLLAVCAQIKTQHEPVLKTAHTKPPRLYAVNIAARTSEFSPIQSVGFPENFTSTYAAIVRVHQCAASSNQKPRHLMFC